MPFMDCPDNHRSSTLNHDVSPRTLETRVTQSVLQSSRVLVAVQRAKLEVCGCDQRSLRIEWNVDVGCGVQESHSFFFYFSFIPMTHIFLLTVYSLYCLTLG